MSGIKEHRIGSSVVTTLFGRVVKIVTVGQDRDIVWLDHKKAISESKVKSSAFQIIVQSRVQA